MWRCRRVARIFGCRVSFLLMKYLDLPLGASYEATSIWNGIIEKIGLDWLDGKGFVYLWEVD
jgi:hypothetical protein